MKVPRRWDNGLRIPLLLSSLVPACIALAAPAELVVRRANVITIDAKLPRAQAFAVAGGKFAAVGSDESMKPFIGENTRVLDLAGKTVVPGFIDAHAHPGPEYPEDSPWASVDCRPEKVRAIDALVAALKRKAERTPDGQWVTGSRYQETKLGRHPTRWDLDRASTNHPIIISHSSGHQSVCNSLALELAKVTRDTADPAGGKFVRDERGELTGLLQERAAGVVRAAGPRQPNPPEAETLAAYRAGFRRYLSRGVTSVHVAGTSLSGAAMLERARTDELPLRLYIMLREGSLDEALQRKQADGGNTGVRYGAIKLFHGNSLSGQTCWLSKPYENRPDYYGVPPARSQEDLNALILRVHEAGLQACVHSNGDREIEMLLNTFENALQQKPRANHRHRIEHCSVVTEALLQRIKKLGLVVVPHSYIWEHGDKMENFGAWRWDWMHPARSLIDLGIPMAGHSDDPVSVSDPLLRIQDMVTRSSAEGKVYGARQRVTAEEALRAWTLGGAFASFEEDRKGSITAGKLADFVVIADDLTRVEPQRIRQIPVEKTFVGGREVASAARSDVIEFSRQTLTFVPTRADMTVSQAVFSIYASHPEAVRVNGARSNANFMYIDLKRVTTNQFELPPLKIEFPTNNPASVVCVSVKVWFAEVSNQYDSHFYQNLDDRYALVAWCSGSINDSPARARFKQNRVAALAEFTEALRRPVALKLNDRPLRKEWAPQ